MKWPLIAVSASMCGLTPATAIEGFFLGEDIARSCSSERAVVAAYVTGVADAYAMLEATPKFCFDVGGTTATELVDVVCRALSESPAAARLSASGFIVRVLLKAYPCASGF